jgi:hypothetical protein
LYNPKYSSEGKSLGAHAIRISFSVLSPEAKYRTQRQDTQDQTFLAQKYKNVFPIGRKTEICGKPREKL